MERYKTEEAKKEVLERALTGVTLNMRLVNGSRINHERTKFGKRYEPRSVEIHDAIRTNRIGESSISRERWRTVGLEGKKVVSVDIMAAAIEHARSKGLIDKKGETRFSDLPYAKQVEILYSLSDDYRRAISEEYERRGEIAGRLKNTRKVSKREQDKVEEIDLKILMLHQSVCCLGDIRNLIGNLEVGNELLQSVYLRGIEVSGNKPVELGLGKKLA